MWQHTHKTAAGQGAPVWCLQGLPKSLCNALDITKGHWLHACQCTCRAPLTPAALRQHPRLSCMDGDPPISLHARCQVTVHSLPSGPSPHHQHSITNKNRQLRCTHLNHLLRAQLLVAPVLKNVLVAAGSSTRTHSRGAALFGSLHVHTSAMLRVRLGFPIKHLGCGSPRPARPACPYEACTCQSQAPRTASSS